MAGALLVSGTPNAAIAAGLNGGTGGGSQLEMPEGGGAGVGGDMEGGSGSGGSMGAGSGGGADTMTFDYSGSYTGALTASGEEVASEGESYDATSTDQNAALVEDGGTLSLVDAVLTKSGADTDGDSCNFYGVNSILLAVGEGSLACVTGSTLSATSEGSNGIFATDSATVYAMGTSISTSADNSRGLDATYGGTIVAADMAIETQGSHCAAVATDRGGGYVSVTGSTFSTAGEGSPLLYSTGDVEVSDVTGVSTGSQIAGMEGTNTILINASELTSTVTGATASDPVANGVIIYQSTSGDAEASTGDVATFQVANSTLSSSIQSGAMLYFTNTAADVVLSNSTLDFDSSAANLILAAGNDSNNWGSAGSNGAEVKVTAIEQELAGTVEADTISSVDLYLTDGSKWTGATLVSENSAGSTVDEPLSVSVDETSAWVVTEDCELSNLTVADGGQVCDADGRPVTVVAGGQTVVEGSSGITVTVTGAYSTEYDSSNAGTLATELIDRTAFDEAMGTSTAWIMGEGEDADADADADGASSAGIETMEDNTEDDAIAVDPEESTNPVVAFFQGIIDWFLDLFS